MSSPSGAGRREQVFWGWGEPGAGPALPDHAAGFLRAELGVDGGVIAPPPDAGDVVLPASALAGAALEQLERAVGAEWVRADHEARLLRAAGKSYLDLVALRSGRLEAAADAVVAPGSAA